MSQESTVFGREPTRPLPDADDEAALEADLDNDRDPGSEEAEAGATALGVPDEPAPGGEPEPAAEVAPEVEPAPTAEPAPVVEPTGAAVGEPETEPVPGGEPEPAAEVADAARDELSEQFDAAKVVFVDEPRRAVERAAELVGEALREMQVGLHTAAEPSTEDLRVAFQAYRAVFDQIRSAG